MVEAEASVVARVASLYLEGMSYQKLADLLNQEHILFSKEVPVWDKHKVKRLLENPATQGRTATQVFWTRRHFNASKAASKRKQRNRPPKRNARSSSWRIAYTMPPAAPPCTEMGGKNHQERHVVLEVCSLRHQHHHEDEILLEEVIHQMEEWDRPEQTSYQPSGEVIRPTNAINRGLEHPDDPQEVISLILQGAAARYACCPDTQGTYEPPAGCVLGPHPAGGFSYNISEENTVKVTFQQVHRERTEHGTDSTEAGTDHTGNENVNAPLKGAQKHQRVAAYCRVSTDSEEQITSYEAQKAYYTQKIEENPDWELAGIFADKGTFGDQHEKAGKTSIR